ncbi:MAG: respiratory nitrate reductase subunit gamma [Gammaproteobacteria bacterium]|jgi:nitrate reductase gamma subunit|nr:respiratory nitrate reductase subunit gamma [Gammaproteobacteria bacterium]MBT3868652.1 respiratory nitrate reductase subunit gamma [Gammaproteobacteria bacterium]MBT4378700.1 respiratory nitrate reductase subunit gamma [Gammaproteobacteria bacterium]MBT4615315.1 respiratory nitrate reductase subunit gamma [Gammaproteobacteria bacterium]MBT5195983.1 respiratory nitrate reductase subunit gamma [Gammaproteobacteria bacterium]|tara:strand:- start:1809 stop:2537 length:729 start_codon:yes stop_codon:yes gene_type:complete
MNPYDYFFFVIFPYLIATVFLVGTIYRYRKSGYTVTSLSAQFLEGRQGFWGTVPFHWGILMIFLGHLVAFAFPASVLAWNADPMRLIIHEGLGFTFAVAVVIGLCALILRRLTNPRLRVVTSKMDLFVEFMLLAQVLLGCWIALGYRWGSSWFAADLSPYLWSIIQFSPQPEAVYAMPLVIKAHIVGAFSIFLIFPFTRLVHLLVAPFHYLVRPYQVVIWYWDRKLVRQPSTPWSEARPRNN